MAVTRRTNQISEGTPLASEAGTQGAQPTPITSTEGTNIPANTQGPEIPNEGTNPLQVVIHGSNPQETTHQQPITTSPLLMSAPRGLQLHTTDLPQYVNQTLGMPTHTRPPRPPVGGSGTTIVHHEAYVPPYVQAHEAEVAKLKKKLEEEEAARAAGKTPPANDAAKCRAFPQTLAGMAQRWYSRLPPNSIGSFKELSKAFINQFVSGKIHEKSSASLMGIRQGKNETLREYLSRFTKEAIKVPDLEDKVAMIALQQGTTDDHFRRSLAKHPPRKHVVTTR
ncbi:hypothetical protein POM88_019578 [Heracleum sosnowskyi]|uniref:Retrotransposon gag domain-containing protein n=1 Tax=Heracleum sosnowskyi TaxID=360622 RepID=A0AAD8MS16_9APIA|nr:hypothetical protein POM88_019578 [Heracleum sosnowskyi]